MIPPPPTQLKISGSHYCKGFVKYQPNSQMTWAGYYSWSWHRHQQQQWISWNDKSLSLLSFTELWYISAELVFFLPALSSLTLIQLARKSGYTVIATQWQEGHTLKFTLFKLHISHHPFHGLLCEQDLGLCLTWGNVF